MGPEGVNADFEQKATKETKKNLRGRGKPDAALVLVEALDDGVQLLGGEQRLWQ
jgi:hypothetical protein